MTDGDTSTGTTATSDTPTTGTPGTSDTSSTATTDASSTGTATTDDSSTGASTTEPVCLEIESQNYDEFKAMSRTCSLDELCPGPGALVFSMENNNGWSTDDIKRARCMAAALRDRTPGWLHYVHYAGVSEFRSTREILGEQVIVRQEDAHDFSAELSERVTFLKPPEFFADCAIGTAAAAHKCLTEGFTDECATSLECPN